MNNIITLAGINDIRREARDVAGRLVHGREARLDVGAAPRERVDPVETLDDVGLERERREMGALGLRRRAHVVVEAVDEDAATAVDERVEGGDEAPGRVRQVRRGTRVRIARHRSDAQLDVEDALAAQEQLRTSGGVDRAALLQRAVAVGEGRVEREEAREVRAAALLLSFYQEAHVERQVAVDGAIRLDGLDAQEQVAFVVIDAAREDRAVAHRRVVGRAAPKIEGHRGLDVVVLHADERPLARAHFAHDERRRSIHAELARLRAGRDQTLAAPARGRVERACVGRLRRDGAELAQVRG